jgi:DNA-binding NtrC family response regulator
MMNTILIVDDEPRICEVLREFFHKSQGMLVQCAHAGPDATRMLKRECYDLALIGIPLTGSSAFDLVKLAANRNTPVLLMTGHSLLQLEMQRCAISYLGKPFTLVALGAAAGRIMNDRGRQVASLKASLTKLQAGRDALARSMDEADRLLDVVRARQQVGRWASAVRTGKDSLPVDDNKFC